MWVGRLLSPVESPTGLFSDSMTESAIEGFITGGLANTTVTENNGNLFFFFQHPGATEAAMFPFVTLVTSDEYDQFSDLNRPGVFRLNIGVSKETFKSLFPKDGSQHDFTALDTVMPHPVYGDQSWISILNPGPSNEEQVKAWIQEAYDRSAQYYGRMVAHKLPS